MTDTGALLGQNDTLPKAGKVRLMTLGHLDGRTLASRRARQLIAEMENDFKGAEMLSVGTRELIKHAALLGAMIESEETKWLAGEPIDHPTYLATINAHRRLIVTIEHLAAIGSERRVKDITPSLDDIAADIASRRNNDPDGDDSR